MGTLKSMRGLPVVWLPNFKSFAGGSFEGCEVRVMDSFEASNSARCAGALSHSKEIWGELIPGAMVYGPLAMARGYYFSLHNCIEQCGRRLGPQICLRQRANRRTAGPCVSKQGIWRAYSAVRREA